MGREGKFRAKNTINGNWVYGFYYKDKGHNYIHSGHTIYPVHPWSIGEITGLKDKKGIDIYEGDMLESSNQLRYAVTYNSETASFQTTRGLYNLNTIDWFKSIVIGNVHESPELL